MTNSPPYDEQLVLLKQYQGLGGNKPLPGTADADDRFVRGAYYLTKLPEQPTRLSGSGGWSVDCDSQHGHADWRE